MIGHGPDNETYQNAVSQQLTPTRYKDTLAFMFETKMPWLISEEALMHPARQLDYSKCWQSLGSNFSG